MSFFFKKLYAVLLSVSDHLIFVAIIDASFMPLYIFICTHLLISNICFYTLYPIDMQLAQK